MRRSRFGGNVSRHVRCFVALDLPLAVCRHLANVTQPLHGRFDVKWVPPEHMHATLVFAGDLPGDAVDEMIDIVQALPMPRLELHLESLGHFPPRGIPRVLWAGLGGDVKALMDLQADLEARLEPLGVAREKRGYTPHLTLGRVRSNFGAFALADEMRKVGDSLNRKPFAPEALVLYDSELLPQGPTYTVRVERLLPQD